VGHLYRRSSGLPCRIGLNDQPSQNAWETFDMARPKSLSRQLHAARVARRLSVAEIADQLGVSTASIYFWESGRVRPRDANLTALCKVLKLPIRATRQLAGA
jgi:DNA-binding transcriptional regulator YiaG